MRKEKVMAEVKPKEVESVEDDGKNKSKRESLVEQSFCQKFISQTTILTKKNFIIQRRFKEITAGQFCVGLLLIIILIVFSGIIVSNYQIFESLFANTSPQELVPLPFQCQSKYGLNGKCYSFALVGNEGGNGWTKENDIELGKEVAKIAGIPGENENEGWKYFNTTDDFKEWALDSPNTTRVAVKMDFTLEGLKLLSYEFYVNKSFVCTSPPFSGCFLSYMKDTTMSLQQYLDSALLRKYSEKKDSKVTITFKDFPKDKQVFQYDPESQLGSFLFPFAIYVLFGSQVVMIMNEKDRKLPAQLRQMGMLDISYWASWIISNFTINLAFTFVMIAFGAIMQMKIFLYNDFFLTFFTFWLVTCAFSCQAFVVTGLMNKTNQAMIAVVVLILLYAIPAQIGAQILYGFGLATNANGWRYFLAATPLIGPALQLYYLVQHLFGESSVGGNGYRTSEIPFNTITPQVDENGVPYDDFWSVQIAFLMLFAQVIINIFLANYIQNITPNAYGKRKSFCFCLMPSYWSGKNKALDKTEEARTKFIKIGDDMSEEVRKEAEMIRDKNYGDRKVAVEIIGMTKKFGSFTAVDGIAYAIDEGQLVALLGHNGAGKTTTINMLVGNMDVTDGDALVFGRSLALGVAKNMGNCPQHDILWDHLTGAEHLRLFAIVKGVPAHRVEAEVETRLKDVNLHAPEYLNIPVRAYSGGMKRRLSIAIALVGDPEVVTLDEPTTGMDPVTRSDVWKCIQKAKKGRVILLTSHSMEEADVLGDRIAVMSHGRIQALGTGLQLKKRYGKGMVLTVLAPEKSAHDGIVEFVRENIFGQVDKIVGSAIYMKLPDVDSQDEYVEFFEKLEAAKETLNYHTFSVGLPTLEEVFVELSKLDERKLLTFQFPAAEGVKPGMVVAYPLNDGTQFEVTLPDGKKAGESFTVEYKQYTVAIPAGTAAGTKLQYNQDGEDFVVTVPAGSPAQVTQKVQLVKKKGEVIGRKATKSPVNVVEVEPAKITIGSSCKAMCGKSWHLKKRQKLQICCQMISPMVLILLISLINIAFDSIKLQVMCGPGILSKDQCTPDKRYNLTCVKRLVETLRTSKVDFGVGVQGNFFTAEPGSASQAGATRNCGPDGNKSWVCFNGMERPDFQIPTTLKGTNVGSITHVRSPILETWYKDLRVLYTKSKCMQIYQDAYNCGQYCDDKTREQREAEGGKKQNKGDCVDDCQLRLAAVQWASAARGNAQGFQSCLPETPVSQLFNNITNVRSLTDQEVKDKCDPKVLKFCPQLDDVFKIQETAEECQEFDARDIAAHFKSIDLDTEIDNAVASKVQSGVYGNLTTRDYTDSGAATFFSRFIGKMVEALGDSDQLMLERNTGINKGNAVFFLYAFTPVRICDLMTGTFANPTAETAQLKTARMLRYDTALAAGLNVTADKSPKFSTLCKAYMEIDAVRGLSTTEQADATKLNEYIVEKWNEDKEHLPTSAQFEKWNLSPPNEPFKWLGYKAHTYGAVPAAYDTIKMEDDTGTYKYISYYNFSGTDGNYWLPSSPSMPKLVQFMDNAIMKRQTGYSISGVSLGSIPTKAVCNRNEWVADTTGQVKLDCPALLPTFLRFSITDFLTGNFMAFFLMIPIWFMVEAIMYEKDRKLRTIIVMQGMRLPVYWGSTYAIEYGKYLLQMACIIIAGFIVDLQYVTLNDFGVLFFFMFIWGHVCFVFSAFISSIFSNGAVASTVTFLLILCSYATRNAVESLIQIDAPFENLAVFMIWPPFVVSRWHQIFTLAGGTGTPVTGDSWTTSFNGHLPATMGIMVLHYFVWILLAWFFENSKGEKGFSFIISREWWSAYYTNYFGRKEKVALTDEGLKKFDVVPAGEKDSFKRGEDTQKEHEAVLITEEDRIIRVVNLHKRFGKFTAVKSLSFGVKKHECFGLLGHNGAGKTTTINMLTGLLNPDSGNAYVGTDNILTDLAVIYGRMGVCPQHDILWDTMTGREHLEFYARLKGQPAPVVKKLIAAALESVSLTFAKDRLSGGYSGGMKRRLTMANSIVGNPDILYMDEPSTGLDPASKHQLWEVIEAAKGSKSMILTTHSMEEADVLCDRIGIMANGEMQCLGYSHELKQRFGRGYTLVIMTMESTRAKYDEVDQLVKSLFPSALLLDEPMSGLSKYDIDRGEVVISKAFKEMNDQKDDIGIVSWGLMETTMEQVFLKLAAVAHDFTSSKSENISAADKNKTMAERVEDLERKVHSSTLASNLVTVEDDVKDA